MQRDPKIDDRLGLNVLRETRPTPPLLKSYDAAGFSWRQVEPRRSRCRPISSAPAATPARCGPRSTRPAGRLPWPRRPQPGTELHDRLFGGLLDYAAEARAELVVYHGLNFRNAEDVLAARALGDRVELRRAGGAAPPRDGCQRLGVRRASRTSPRQIPGRRRLRRPGRVQRVRAHRDAERRDAVRRRSRRDRRRHAARRGAAPARARARRRRPVHLHDDLGARGHAVQAPGVDLLRLDRPAAGAGPLRGAVAGALGDHDAPLDARGRGRRAPGAARARSPRGRRWTRRSPPSRRRSVASGPSAPRNRRRIHRPAVSGGARAAA